jgi:uncharacterized membrane protein YraQ (UPF0718 family)
MVCSEKNCQERGHSKHHHLRRRWYKEPLFIIIFVILAIFFIHLILSFSGVELLQPLFDKFFGYLRLTWWAVLLGLLIGALIEILVPEGLMISLLRRGKKSILIAVLLGFIASACSHGILAIAVSLYKKGASTASTLAFLLAAPWANLAITVLLFSLFGIRAFLIIGGALVVAIISGFVFQVLEEKEMIEGKGKRRPPNPPKADRWVNWLGWERLIKEIGRSIWSLAKMVVWWILLGFFLASLIGAFVPEHFFHRFFGPSLLGMLATLVLASVIEVCSEGSAPLAFELFQKTGAFGNAFVFLQAGVATDFTEIGIVATNIGKRAAIALILTTVPMILLLGFLFNNLVV